MRPTLFHPRHEQRHHLFSVPEALHRNVVSTATPVTVVSTATPVTVVPTATPVTVVSTATPVTVTVQLLQV